MTQSTQLKPKSSFAMLSKALAAFRSRGRTTSECKPDDSQALQEYLDNAKPAEMVWGPDDYEAAGAEYCVVRSRCDPKDGMWVCCCGNENGLVHYQGLYPFKHLNCRQCSHTLCPDCRTSEILTPIQATTLEVSEDRFHEKSREVRYCRLCRACGLTHRATIKGNFVDFTKVACPCQNLATEEDACFFIGAVDQWRLDPPGQAVALCLDRLIAASQRCMNARRLEAEKSDSPARVTQSSPSVLIPPPPLPEAARTATWQPNLRAEDRPQQQTRATTADELTFPVRRGGLRRARRRFPTVMEVMQSRTAVEFQAGWFLQ